MAEQDAPSPSKPANGTAMSDQDQATFIMDARKKFDDALLVDIENRERGLEDALFVGDPNAQWPADVKAARANRPCLTVNELPQYVRQVTGDVRLNRPSIKVRAAEDGDVEIAKVYEGLIRSIENQSDATRVYVERVEDSARCNMGWMRVTTEYCDDETFDLDLRIKGIANPFSVVWDPSATDPTLRDARYIFVYDDMPVADFEAAYPNAKVSGFDGQTTIDAAGTTAGQNAPSAWANIQTIRVCEYWCVEREEVTLNLLSDGRTVIAGEDDTEIGPENAPAAPVAPEGQPGMASPPQPAPTIVRSRKAMRPKVVQYTITGAEILSGPHEWPGDRIPIVPVWGEVYRIGSRKVRKSLITDAKDAVRMANYAHSAYVERTAMAPKAPWLVTPKMTEGLEAVWKAASTGNPAVLTYNPDGAAPAGPQRIMPAPVEAAWVQEMAMTREMLHATTGIYPAALGQHSNETSGKAINARKQESDVGSYVFVDNLTGAIREIGRIAVQMIPKVYDGARQVRIIGPMDEAGVAKINQPGGVDLSQGKYDITVDTGPSFSTRRAEAAESMTQFAQAVGPQGAILLAPMIAKNMDWPQAEEVSQLFQPLAQAMMPPPPGTPPPPDPKAEAQMQQMQMQAQMDAQRGQHEVQMQQMKMQHEAARSHADLQMKALELQGAQQQQEFEREKIAMQQQTMRLQAQFEAHQQSEKMKQQDKAA